VLIWLVLEIPKGTLVATDELLTAERTREMLSTEPWVVHFNFKPSFEKAAAAVLANYADVASL